MGLSARSLRRFAGKGDAIVDRDSRTHLAHMLELTEEPAPVQAPQSGQKDRRLEAPCGSIRRAPEGAVQTILGIIPVAPLNVLTVYPVLPEWPELTLRNLRVADTSLTLRFRRKENGRTTYEVLEKHDGSLR